jgi:hypothetical protein
LTMKKGKYMKDMREMCSRKRTNQSNKSLISADRTNKGTLPLTILCCIFKSSAKDFTFPIFENYHAPGDQQTFPFISLTLHNVIQDRSLFVPVKYTHIHTYAEPQSFYRPR